MRIQTVGNERLGTNVLYDFMRVSHKNDIEVWIVKLNGYCSSSNFQKAYGMLITKNNTVLFFVNNLIQMRLTLLTEEEIYMQFLQDHYMS